MDGWKSSITKLCIVQEEEEEEEILGSDDDEQEAPTDYCKGGYHPVKIGDLFHNRYHVIRFVTFPSFLAHRGTELKTLEWDIFNPDQLINLKINYKK